MCDVLEVSRSGYYKWLNTEPSGQEVLKEKIKKKIYRLFMQYMEVYGSPRIMQVLHRLDDPDYHVSEKTVGRYMREMGLRATPKEPYVVTTDSNHSQPIYPNLLNRQFNPEAPNEAWATDITYIWTSEGWLYLATVLDLYSRKIIGWEMADKMTKELCLTALDRALDLRKPSS